MRNPGKGVIRLPSLTCDYRWLTGERGSRWWHSCELDPTHPRPWIDSDGQIRGRHFCACDASSTGRKKSLTALPLPPSNTFPEKSPERSFEQYLEKCGGVPDIGSGSDEAVFRAAIWAAHNVPDLSEYAFVLGIRRFQPTFDERWITQRWKSAHRGS
jgi:hypothetical protein